MHLEVTQDGSLTIYTWYVWLVSNCKISKLWLINGIWSLTKFHVTRVSSSGALSGHWTKVVFPVKPTEGMSFLKSFLALDDWNMFLSSNIQKFTIIPTPTPLPRYLICLLFFSFFSFSFSFSSSSPPAPSKVKMIPVWEFTPTAVTTILPEPSITCVPERLNQDFYWDMSSYMAGHTSTLRKLAFKLDFDETLSCV